MMSTAWNINQFFISYLIISPSFVVFGEFDQAGRIKAILLLLCLYHSIMQYDFRKVFYSKAIISWGVWSIFSLGNWLYAGTMTENMYTWAFIFTHFVFPLFAMIFVYYEGSIDFEYTLKNILISFCIYIIIGIAFQDAGSGNGTDWDARGGQLLGNTLALNACILSFTGALAHVLGYINKKTTVLILGLALFAIMFISTRKALGGYAIILIFLSFTYFDYRKPENIFFAFLSAILAYMAIGYIMENTQMGARLNEISAQSEEYSTGNAFFDLFGDRSIHYYLGWQLFLDHPFVGVGTKNALLYSGLPYPFHSEYIGQLAEGGIVGSVLYVFFNFSIIKTIIHFLHEWDQKIGLVCLSGILCVLFISFTAWTYQFPFYFILFGLLLACCNPIEISELNEETIEEFEYDEIF